MQAGYSKRSLVEKLGIKPGFRVSVYGYDGDYAALLGDLPEGVLFVDETEATPDLIHYFSTDIAALLRDFPLLKQRMPPYGTLWISWPKQAAKVATDVTENRVRLIGLENGLVDVKVCAVDARWSGLKFVYRLADRKG